MKKKLLLLSLVFVTLFIGISATNANAQRTRRFTANINGATVAYAITGNGDPVFLIHGYPLNGDLFDRQRDLLADSGYRVITIDLRGFGRSVAPNDQASVDLYAADCLALLNLLNIERAVIGGHSLGGAITLRLYQLAPQRFRGMILNAPAFLPPPTVEQFMWRGYQQQSREQGAASLLPLLLPEFLTGRARTRQPQLVTEVSNLILAASVNGLVGGARALETRPDLRPVLPTISVPTLILYGEEDSLTPIEQARMLRMMIPNSELAIIRQSSHGVVLEDADAANSVIRDFLYDRIGFGTGTGERIALPDSVLERIITSEN